MDPDWLVREGNEQYDVEARIVGSGKAWGDDEDPEVLAERVENVKVGKKAINEMRKRKMMDDALRQGAAKKGKATKGGKIQGNGKVRAKSPGTGDEESE